MNGRAIPGAYLFTFRLTNVIPERIIFVSRGITVNTTLVVTKLLDVNSEHYIHVTLQVLTIEDN